MRSALDIADVVIVAFYYVSYGSWLCKNHAARAAATRPQ
jgi:hypothetical protein